MKTKFMSLLAVMLVLTIPLFSFAEESDKKSPETLAFTADQTFQGTVISTGQKNDPFQLPKEAHARGLVGELNKISPAAGK